MDRHENKTNADWKSWLINSLRENRMGKYADILEDFEVSVTKAKRITGGIASIAVEEDSSGACTDATVYLDKDFVYGDASDFRICTIIKHEVLHAIRRHKYQSIEHIKRMLGYYGTILSDEQMNNILRVRNKANRIFKDWNVANTFNVAGDLDLSRLYTEQEKEEIRALNGLISDVYPNIKGKNYLQIADIMAKDGMDIDIRSADERHYGKIDSDGNFIEDSSRGIDTNEFLRDDGYNIIKMKDVRNIALPYVRDVPDLKILIQDGEGISYFGGRIMLASGVHGKSDTLYSYDASDDKMLESKTDLYQWVYPVINVTSLPEYAPYIYEFNVSGDLYVRLPHSLERLIRKTPLGPESNGYKFSDKYKYNDKGPNSKDFSKSLIKRELDNYINFLRNKEKQSQ